MHFDCLMMETKEPSGEGFEAVTASPPTSTRKSNTLAAAMVKDQVVGFGDRVTYIFAHDREVGSIHFDRLRGEIFYKGHNIRHLPLEAWQLQKIVELQKMLSQHAQYHDFASSYGKALEKITLDRVRNGLK